MNFSVLKAIRLFPPCCVLCRRKTSGASICDGCKADIHKTLPACTVCQLALTHENRCGACLSVTPNYTRIYTLGDYSNSLNRLITGLKFENQLAFSRALSELLIPVLSKAYCEDSLPALILPIPLHAKRLKQRGFNQALEIAKPLAKHFNIPLNRFNSIRTKNTKTQTSLPKSKRRQNLANAFQIAKPLTAKHIAIVDDVVTTTSTVNAFAKLLKQQGAARVDVWCCARTQLD